MSNGNDDASLILFELANFEIYKKGDVMFKNNISDLKMITAKSMYTMCWVSTGEFIRNHTTECEKNNITLEALIIKVKEKFINVESETLKDLRALLKDDSVATSKENIDAVKSFMGAIVRFCDLYCKNIIEFSCYYEV